MSERFKLDFSLPLPAIPFAYSWRSIAVRKGSSAMAVGGIALVVLVLVAMLSLAEGFANAVKSSGSPNNLIVMRKGADAELQSLVTRDAARVIAELPFVARDEAGEPLFVAESVIILNKPKRGGGETNVTVRGTPTHARKVHREVRLTDGRWFTPGTDEAVIGDALARRLEGFDIGQVVTAGRRDWKIVGVFDAEGSALESEMWVDVAMMQTVFNRGNLFQSLLFRAAGDPDAAVGELRELIDDDPRLRTTMVQTENSYYQKQSELMSKVITTLGTMLTMIMAIGAIVGAMNTMYAAVSQRKREIGCMLSMGFTPEAIWFAFILEALLLAAVGAAVGCALSLLFDGVKTGTTNFMTFSETAFEFHVTPQILAVATVIALIMGLIGGFLPALHAARMKVVDALRRA